MDDAKRRTNDKAEDNNDQILRFSIDPVEVQSQLEKTVAFFLENNMRFKLLDFELQQTFIHFLRKFTVVRHVKIRKCLQ